MALSIQKAGRKGFGVFTDSPIQNGKLIHRLSGRRLSGQQVFEKVHRGSLNWDDPLQISPRRFIPLDKMSRAFNHSCNPNCRLRRDTGLYAVRDIQPFEELTYEYSTTVPQESFRWKMKCECRSANYRGVLSTIAQIPSRQLRLYQKLKIISPWILKD